MMDYVRLARPRQWLKNALIFAPAFFAREILDLSVVGDTAAAFVAFCLLASSIYSFNDVMDRDQDREHPEKNSRPVASRSVSVVGAMVFALVLAVMSAITTFLWVPAIAPILALYAVLNLLYSYRLKHVAVLDLILVSVFYVLRIMAGGLATGTYISGWLIICVIFFSLFVIIAKRRAEYSRVSRRKVLEEYTEAYLDHLMTVSVALTLVSYGIYTVLGQVPALAIYSNFFVIFALFKYLHIVYTSDRSESPEKMIVDPAIMASTGLWLAYMFAIFYY